MADKQKNERIERIRRQMKMYHGTPAEKAAAIEEICNENTSLVVDIINKHYPSYKKDYFEDLKQEGIVGLLESLEVFDPDKGALATIATFYIIHNINDYISRFVHGVRPHYNRFIKRARAAIDELEGKGITNPSHVDIAMISGLSIAEVRRALDVYNKTQLQSYESEEYLDSMITNTQMLPDETYEDMEKKEILDAAIAELTEDEKKVISMRFQLGDYVGKSKQPSNLEISQATGVPLHMIRSTSQSALRKLRENKALAALFTPEREKSYDEPISVTPLKAAQEEANYLLDDGDIEIKTPLPEKDDGKTAEDLKI